MISKFRKILIKHIKSNINRYFLLLLAFTAGISAGAFTVNGLSAIQSEELINYFNGFIKLLYNQEVDANELLKVAFIENIKIVMVLWILGVTIIGIPFIFVVVGIRGFITGFSSGFIINMLGGKGILFTLFALLPEEIVIVPCILALGVNGINFSLNIIKNKSIKHITKESLKSNFFAYCLSTLVICCVIFVGVLVEVYITPVFIRMITPIITSI